MIWLLDLLRTPSAFRYDPWGYVRNQVGHGYLVGGGLILLGMPLWLLLAGYALWETIQFVCFEGEADDGFEDFGHVSCIAFAFHFEIWPLLIVQAAFLISGFLFRKRFTITAPKD